MDSDYEKSDEDFQPQECEPEDYAPRRKRLTKNQQIYGDFTEAYQPEPSYLFSKPTGSYNQFKAGATIESYSSEVEVTLPLRKPKQKQAPRIIQESQEGDKPILGQFSLSSFLSQFGNEGLDDIAEEQEESSVQAPVGLSDKILQHLQLVKVGEEQTEEVVDIQKMSFERYMRMGKPAPPPPKYKNEEEKELARSFKESYGIGFKMLESMGFKNISKGLGKNESGIHKPVEAVHKTAFTMKDSVSGHRAKEGESEAEEGEDQRQEIPIPEQLFAYRSRNPKINDFLVSLQKDYERLNSQIYFLENEVGSMKSKLEISLSTQCQEQNQTEQLRSQIEKLQVIAQDIDKCTEHPHLGEHYQADLLFVKKVYDKLKRNGLDFVHTHVEKELMGLKGALFQFYLAKSKESLKLFQRATAIEQKIHKNISKKHKRQEQVINLDKSSDEDVEVVTIGVDEQQKIKRFVELVINRTVVPHIEDILARVDSLHRVTDSRVIDLIDVVNRFDEEHITAKKLLTKRILPLYENYVNRLELDDLQSEKVKILPHHVILPWLHILKLSKGFTLLKLYKALSRKLWNLENSVLYNIVTPLLKFSSEKDLSFFRNLCLGPRILNQLEAFSIGNPNSALLTGFAKYSELLTESIREQILENTLFVEVQQVYRVYAREKEEGEVLKWVKGWRKFSDKIVPGRFSTYFQQKIRVS